MRLWSIQPPDAVARLEADGFLVARPDFAVHWGAQPGQWGFEQAYAWMARQMRARIGDPPPGVAYPMWAWARPPRRTLSGAPDLRGMPEELPCALFELELDPAEVLLSDHGSWHHVLNGWPLALSESLCAQAEAEAALVLGALGSSLTPRGAIKPEDVGRPEVLAFLSQGWQSIFDIEPLVEGRPARMAWRAAAEPGWVHSDDVPVQACAWRVERRHVLSWRIASGRPGRRAGAER